MASENSIDLKCSSSPRGEDPALDFLSEEFDPKIVLQSSPSKVKLPHPAILPCDNLQIYSSVVQGTSRYAGRTPDLIPGTASDLEKQDCQATGVGGANEKVSPSNEYEANLKTGPSAVKGPGHSTSKTVMDFMQTRSSSGPFSLLHDSWLSGCQVKVLTRHCTGVRGVCVGRLVAFDRHMNLVLGEVEEWWAPLRTASNGGIISKNQRRRQRSLTGKTFCESLEGCCQNYGGRSQWECHQLVEQLFLRGDSVVLVSTASENHMKT